MNFIPQFNLLYYLVLLVVIYITCRLTFKHIINQNKDTISSMIKNSTLSALKDYDKTKTNDV